MNVEVTGPSILFSLPILGGIDVTQTLISPAASRCWWKRASECCMT